MSNLPSSFDFSPPEPPSGDAELYSPSGLTPEEEAQPQDVAQTPPPLPAPGSSSGVVPDGQHGLRGPVPYNRDRQLLQTVADNEAVAREQKRMKWPRDLLKGGTPLPMNPVRPPQQGERVDGAISFDERAAIDWWEVRSRLYGHILPRELKPDDPSMLANAAALRTHRAWGGVDGRQVPGTVKAVNERQQKFPGTRPPLFAPSPLPPEEMPFDPRDMPQFIDECIRRLDRPECKRISVHGATCPVIALYGMPAKPFQEIYESKSDVVNRAMCMGFGDIEKIDSETSGGFLRELAEIGRLPSEGRYKAEPPKYTIAWRTHAHLTPPQAPPANLVTVGSANMTVHYNDTIEKIFPKVGFWQDPLISKAERPPQGMTIYEIDPVTHKTKPNPMSPADQRQVFLEMAGSNGVVLRGPKPVPSALFDWTRPRAKDRTRAEKRSTYSRKYDYSKSYPSLGHVCAEAYTTLTAAACGIHPPVFACAIVCLPNKTAIMLILTEKGMNTLHSGSNTGIRSETKNDWPVTFGVSDPPPHHYQDRSSGPWLDNDPYSTLYHRAIVAKHISNRLSDLLFRSSMLGFLAGDIKEGNLVTMRPYYVGKVGFRRQFGVGRPNASNNWYTGDMIVDFSWVPYDVMHIDCDPRFACFIPRSVHTEDARLGYTEYESIQEAQFYVTMHLGSGPHQNPGAHFSNNNNLVVHSTCLRLIMLLLTVLHAFCGSYAASSDDDMRYRQLLSLETNFSQLFSDIFGILRDRGDSTFGAICNELLTEDAFEGLFQNKIDKDEKKILRREVADGWNTVTNLTDLKNGLKYEDTERLWVGIAKIIKSQLHHYWLHTALNGKPQKVAGPATADGRPGKPVKKLIACPTKIFEEVSDGVTTDAERQPDGVTMTMVSFSFYVVGEGDEGAFGDIIVRLIYGVLEKEGLPSDPEQVRVEAVPVLNQETEGDTLFSVLIYFSLRENAERMAVILTRDLEFMDETERFYATLVAYQPTMPEIKQVGTSVEGLPEGAKGWHKIVLDKLYDKYSQLSPEYGEDYRRNMLMMLVGFLGYGITAVGRNVKTPTTPSTSTPIPTGSS